LIEKDCEQCCEYSTYNLEEKASREEMEVKITYLSSSNMCGWRGLEAGKVVNFKEKGIGMH